MTALAQFKYLNACVWSAASAGTGSFVVSAAVTGYYTPAQCTNPVVVTGAKYRYFARDGSGNHEEGIGVYTVSSTTLTRATIVSSSNSGSVVDFPGAPSVSMGAPLAADMVVTPDTVNGFPLVQNLVVSNGKPWADVTAYGASSGATATTNTAAIQAAIDYMYATYGGGIVFFPPGNYTTNGTITVKGAVMLVGSGRGCTVLGNAATDFTVLTFDTSCDYAGAERLFIVGYFNAGATNPCVAVPTTVPVCFRDCNIWFGLAALFTNGVDGLCDNCFIAGMTYNVLSGGANWYVRCKIDDAGTSPTYGFFQSATLLSENHFTQCDLSGGSMTLSVQISDGSPFSITHFDGCVFSSGINITNHRATMFSGCEFGSTSFAGNANTTIVGSFGFSAMNPSALGVKVAGNINIS